MINLASGFVFLTRNMLVRGSKRHSPTRYDTHTSTGVIVAVGDSRVFGGKGATGRFSGGGWTCTEGVGLYLGGRASPRGWNCTEAG